MVDIAERMIRLRGLRPHEDIEIKYTGIRPGEKLHEELYTDLESVTNTEHPEIVKLVEPYKDLDFASFPKQVELILQSKLSSSEAMQQLLELIDNPTLNDQVSKNNENLFHSN